MGFTVALLFGSQFPSLLMLLTLFSPLAATATTVYYLAKCWPDGSDNFLHVVEVVSWPICIMARRWDGFWEAFATFAFVI